jgi:hypothetical protein
VVRPSVGVASAAGGRFSRGPTLLPCPAVAQASRGRSGQRTARLWFARVSGRVLPTVVMLAALAVALTTSGPLTFPFVVAIVSGGLWLIFRTHPER